MRGRPAQRAGSAAPRPLAFPVHEFWSARRGGTRRRGRGCAPAASPTRLTRRPAGGAQDEGVPLRQSTPPPPTPPAPVARTAWKLGGGLEGGEGEHARDQEELVEIGVHVVVIGVAPAWTVEAAGNAGLPEMRGVVTRVALGQAEGQVH